VKDKFTSERGSFMSDVKRIDFETGTFSSEGCLFPGTEEKLSILFNQKVISEREVKRLINNGAYEHDNRIVVMTRIQADALKGIYVPEMHPEGSDFYDRKNT